MTARRWPALVLIPALLVAAALVDRGGDTDQAREEPDDVLVEPSMPVVADRGASSTWYCGAGSGSGDDFVSRQTLVIANTADEVRRGTVTAFPDQGQPVEREVEVAARARTTLDTGELTDAAAAGALVEFDGDGVAVSEVVEGQWGEGASECVSSVAERWYLAAGETTADAHLAYYVMNPFPDAAILDLSFATEEEGGGVGVRRPQAFQGLVVPGSSTLMLNIGDVVTRRGQVSASIEVRTGRVAVDRVQAFDGTGDRSGLAVAPGEPAPAETLFFAAHPAAEGVEERYVLFNPGEDTAEVDVQVVVDDPGTNGSVAPIEVTVPAGEFLALGTGDELWGAVPGGVGHSVIVRSANGVPVVADRRLVAREPATPGVALSPGTPLVATSWTVATGRLDGADEIGLAMLNPSTEGPAQVTVRVVADGEEEVVAELEIPAGERAWIDLGRASERTGSYVEIEASSPVVPEVDYQLDDPDDRALVRAVPVAGTAEVPAAFAD